VLVDTPGQIEIFTWSASGALVSEALATHFPTVIVFVLDAPRCASPKTFMANMLQAVSILYKMRLPMVLAFNKIDVARHEFALEWMADFETFHAALEGERGYGTDLARSLSLVLDEFYAGLRCVGVSALSGEGAEALQEAIEAGAEEYTRTYAVELAAARAARVTEEAGRAQANLARFRRDHAATVGGRREVGGDAGAGPGGMRRGGEEAEDSDDDDDEGGGGGAGRRGAREGLLGSDEEEEGDEDEEYEED
jgi:hypothetical protein